MEVAAKKNIFKRVLVFTPLTRFFHWIRAFTIFCLIVSGFYIAYPFLSPNPSGEPTGFLNAIIRSAHIIAGFVLIAISILRFYLFLIRGKTDSEHTSLHEITSSKIWIAQIKNYLLLGPHPKDMKGVYNPIQFFAYFFLAVAILVMSLTGMILYVNVYHEGFAGVFSGFFKWFEVAFGGLANVRMIHHIVTWSIIAFIPVHLYMVTWNALKNPGGCADIIGGYRYVDAEDLEANKQ